MVASYRLFGLETSPFSIKVRSYLRYKKLPFDWVVKGYGAEEEFRSLARSEALPMLVSPNGGIAHDSSLILNQIEAARISPSATPEDPACRALSALLEEYADEWLNKAMFHYRWSTAKAAKAAATAQADQIFKGFEVENRAEIEKSIAKSMSGRLKTIGLNKKNGEIVEASFQRFIKLLNAHLEHHLFLFGGHPSVADFALAGQLIQLLADEVPGNLIRETAPFVAAWCEFMEDPRSGAPFQSFEDVKDTLLPLLRDEVVPCFVNWSVANADSIAAKRKTLTAATPDGEFKQNIQTHSANALAALKAVFEQTPGADNLKAFLESAGLGEIFTLGSPDIVVASVATIDEADDAAADEDGSDGDGDAVQASEEKAAPAKRKSRRRRPRRPRGDGAPKGDSAPASDA